ncbi:MAG TPA: hypothetical protein VGN04_07145 [Herbaspirillum sp.]|jgi:hypothetical protein
MRAWLKRGIVTGLVFAAVWLMMWIYWTSSNRMPTLTGIILYLLVLPIIFLLAIWLIRKGRNAATAAAAAAKAAAAKSVEPPPSMAPDAAERGWTLALLANAVRTPHANSAADLFALLAARDARLALDAELTDGDGFPILSGRIAALDAGLLAQTDAALADRAKAGNLPALSWDAEQLRALTFAADIVRQLSTALMAHPLLDEYHRAAPHLRQSIALPVLQTAIMLPPHWPQENREHAAGWLMHLASENGWPAEKIRLYPLPSPSDHAGDAADTAGSAASAAPLVLIDRLNADIHRQQLPGLALLLACESFISEKIVAEWESAGGLLKGKVNSGRTPGEGAAGFILADRTQAALLDADADTAASLHRVAAGRRDKSADAAGRIGSELLSTLAAQAIAAADTAPDAISLLIADSDHRGSRTAELMSLGYAVLPEIDLGSQCVKVAADCGSAGAVSTLTALALAHQQAGATGLPVLCVSNNDSFERAAIVVGAFVPEAAAATPA